MHRLHKFTCRLLFELIHRLLPTNASPWSGQRCTLRGNCTFYCRRWWCGSRPARSTCPGSRVSCTPTGRWCTCCQHSTVSSTGQDSVKNAHDARAAIWRWLPLFARLFVWFSRLIHLLAVWAGALFHGDTPTLLNVVKYSPLGRKKPVDIISHALCKSALSPRMFKQVCFLPSV